MPRARVEKALAGPLCAHNLGGHSTSPRLPPLPQGQQLWMLVIVMIIMRAPPPESQFGRAGASVRCRRRLSGGWHLFQLVWHAARVCVGGGFLLRAVTGWISACCIHRRRRVCRRPLVCTAATVASRPPSLCLGMDAGTTWLPRLRQEPALHTARVTWGVSKPAAAATHCTPACGVMWKGGPSTACAWGCPNPGYAGAALGAALDR